MSRSRSTSPIHGYREVAPGHYREHYQEEDEPISPIDHPAPTVTLVRSTRVDPAAARRPERRARVVSVSSEDTVTDTISRSSSLAWDFYDSERNPNDNDNTSSTQFNVTVDNTVDQSHVNLVNERGFERTIIEDTISNNSDEEFVEADVSLNTVRPNSAFEMAPGTRRTGARPDNVAEAVHGVEVPQELRVHMKAIRKAEAMWESDFQRLDIDNMARDRLTAKLTKAETLRDDLVEAVIELEVGADEFFTTPIRDAVGNLRNNYDDFLVKLEGCLGGLTTREAQAATAEDATRRVQGARVNAHRDTMLREMEELISEFQIFDTADPTDLPGYVLHQETVTEARTKCKSTMDDVKALIVDATAAGLAEDAAALDNGLSLLRAADRNTGSRLQDKKSTFGLISTSNRDSQADIPPPSFSGTPTSTDFYTFREDWDAYVGSRYMVEPEKFTVLTKTCLTGLAKNAVMRCKTVTEVLEMLKENFGNPRLLLASKLEGIRKMGSNTGSHVKRREWAVEMRCKLDEIHKLATNHSLVDILYHSSVVGEIEAMLPPHESRDYRKDIMAKDKLGIVSPTAYWEIMTKFLGKMVDRLTFSINHELNVGPAFLGEARRKEASKVDNSGKQSKVYAVDGSAAPAPAPSPSPSQQPKDKKTQKNGKKNGKKPVVNANINANVNISKSYTEPKEITCAVCSNVKHKYMFECEKFQTARGKERISIASKNKCCFRCLRVDARYDKNNIEAWWASHENDCKSTYICALDRCGQLPAWRQFHIFMCTFHTKENKEHERGFISEMDSSLVKPGLSFFFHDAMFELDSSAVNPISSPDVAEDDFYLPSIFMLQTIEVKGKELLVFYDSGCGGAGITDKAAELLDTVVIRPGPTQLHVAGGTSTELKTGDERFMLPLSDSEESVAVTGLRMPTLTNPFPVWDIEKAWEMIAEEITQEGHDVNSIPARPCKVGGREVDIMIGIRYMHLHPVLLFMLPSGLGVYKSHFKSPRGENCVLGGPHKAWLKCKEDVHFANPRSFFTQEMKAYVFSSTSINYIFSPDQAYDELQLVDVVEPEVEAEEDYEDCIINTIDIANILNPGTGMESEPDVCGKMHCNRHVYNWIVPSFWDTTDAVYSLREDTAKFIKGELVSSEIAYRCMRCRNCVDCRNSEQFEAISYREEAEQSMIEAAVEYDVSQKSLISKLPFIANPDDHLFPNRYQAEKVLASQLKKISLSEDMKGDVQASFKKLADRDYLTPIDALDPDVKELVIDKNGYYIPWRTVYKEGSLSTPVRMVFDASSRTPGGKSLNDVLAKGQNRINSLYHILLRFRLKPAAFTCDIRLAYNQIKLDPTQYKYQKFLWQADLDPDGPVAEYVIRTLIYGVRPVGNSLIAGFRKLCDHVEQVSPEEKPGIEALTKDAYVDDILHASNTQAESREAASSLDRVLSVAGMEVKGYTFSGFPPPDEVSSDGKSVGLIGMSWFPEDDEIKVEIKPLYFGKVKRGKLPDLVVGDFTSALKQNFTRRSMLSKVAGVFDPLGLVTPVTARLKLDLHTLVSLKLDWDEQIPEEYFETWVRNVQDIQDLREIKFRRSIIPVDAIKPEVELIVSADASQHIAVACVHGRVQKKDGSFACQLLSAKSKLVSNLTIPKAELRAAALAVHVAHSAKHDLGSQLKQSTYVTDSSIVLHWISNDERPLETLVRNAVIDIRRFTSPSQWYHIESERNIADLGTRPASVHEVIQDSDWQIGKDWMRAPWEQMPLKTVEETKLSKDESKEAALETRNPDISGIILPMLITKVSDRYSFGNYIVDPNQYNWPRAVRIMAMILKFVRIQNPNWKPKWAPSGNLDCGDPAYRIGTGAVLTDLDIRFGEHYYFAIGSKEVEHFVPKKDLKDTDKRGDIIYYIGRIMDGQLIGTPVDTMFDVNSLHFVKPVLDRYSPISYSIMAYVHNVVTNHGGAAVSVRCSRELAYILRARDLAVEIRDACRFCVRYKAHLAKVELGKLHESRLVIAPPFYGVQVDLLGPLQARCEHNHRAVVKVWGCVFKDPASGAIAIHTMTSYSTDAFIDCYTRFSSRYGHPSHIYIDEGSQLMKAMKSMEISLVDVTNTLFTKYKVSIQHSTCPVGAHNVQGVVERSIRSIRDLLNKVYKGIRMDVMAYETGFAWISASLNNLPICLGSRIQDLDNLDLITPSRLILGRSSARSIGGHARIVPPSRLVVMMDEIYRSWWTVWKDEKLTDYIPQPNLWKDTNVDVKEGDIVLMLQSEEELKLGSPIWRIARVRSVETSHKDGKVRTAICEYRIPGEKSMRVTRRGVRKIAVIHQEDSLDYVQQLNQATKQSQIHFFSQDLKNTATKV